MAGPTAACDVRLGTRQARDRHTAKQFLRCARSVPLSWPRVRRPPFGLVFTGLASRVLSSLFCFQRSALIVPLLATMPGWPTRWRAVVHESPNYESPTLRSVGTLAGRSGRWRDAVKWPSVPPLFPSVMLPGGTLGTLSSFSLHTKKKEGMREGGPEPRGLYQMCTKRACFVVLWCSLRRGHGLRVAVGSVPIAGTRKERAGTA